MGARHEPETSVVDGGVVEGGPAGDQLGSRLDVEPERLVLVVGLPRSDPGRLHEQLILVQLDVRAEQPLDAVENPGVARVCLEDLVDEGEVHELAQRPGAADRLCFARRHRRLDLHVPIGDVGGLAARHPFGAFPQDPDLLLIQQTLDDENAILPELLYLCL